MKCSANYVPLSFLERSAIVYKDRISLVYGDINFTWKQTHERFRTGDWGVMYPDGYIEVKDRSIDIIVSGGENKSSIEVEAVIFSHPAVFDEAAVVGRPDEDLGVFETQGGSCCNRGGDHDLLLRDVASLQGSTDSGFRGSAKDFDREDTKRAKQALSKFLYTQ
ncbi:hypothetical protein SASPL_113324 [Salvia splendens]|uniref:Uncharacterized protein n=1 Tax=Salvia splendens TaxID=180675 RepID=A0A8X8Y4E5_SALSN|nr:hypothetical protein SASPL_113324 [Salvia splendens]